MTVKELVSLEKSGAMFCVVDSTKIGCYSHPMEFLTEADRNVVGRDFGDRTVVGFIPYGKKVIVYIK